MPGPGSSFSTMRYFTRSLYVYVARTSAAFPLRSVTGTPHYILLRIPQPLAPYRLSERTELEFVTYIMGPGSNPMTAAVRNDVLATFAHAHGDVSTAHAGRQLQPQVSATMCLARPLRLRNLPNCSR